MKALLKQCLSPFNMLLSAVIIGALCVEAQAVNVTWVSTSSTDFKVASNWSPSTVPTAGQTAVFNQGTGLQTSVTDTTVSIAGITFQGTGGLNNYTIGSSSETMTLSATGGAIIDNQTIGGGSNVQIIGNNITATANGLSILNAASAGGGSYLYLQGQGGQAAINWGTVGCTIAGASVVSLTGGTATTSNSTILKGSGPLTVGTATYAGNFFISAIAPLNAPLANTYSGNTIITRGKLVVYGNDSSTLGTATTAAQLGSSSTPVNVITAIYYDSIGTGFTQTRKLTVGGQNSSGTTIIGAGVNSTGLVQMGNNPITWVNQDVTFLTNGSSTTMQFLSTSKLSGTGTGGAIFDGGGTFELQGTYSWGGDTTVQGGSTLMLGKTGSSIKSGTTLTISGTGSTVQLALASQFANGVNLVLDGGTLDLNNLSPSSGTNTMGTFSATSNPSILDFGGTGTTKITFTGVGTIDPSALVTIDNWNTGGTDHHLIFKSTTGLTTSHFKFNINSVLKPAIIATISGNLELVPVPEPSTILGGIFAVCASGYSALKKRKRKASIAEEV